MPKNPGRRDKLGDLSGNHTYLLIPPFPALTLLHVGQIQAAAFGQIRAAGNTTEAFEKRQRFQDLDSKRRQRNGLGLAALHAQARNYPHRFRKVDCRIQDQRLVLHRVGD